MFKTPCSTARASACPARTKHEYHAVASKARTLCAAGLARDLDPLAFKPSRTAHAGISQARTKHEYNAVMGQARKGARPVWDVPWNRVLLFKKTSNQMASALIARLPLQRKESRNLELRANIALLARTLGNMARKMAFTVELMPMWAQLAHGKNTMRTTATCAQKPEITEDLAR